MLRLGSASVMVAYENERTFVVVFIYISFVVTVLSVGLKGGLV